MKRALVVVGLIAWLASPALAQQQDEDEPDTRVTRVLFVESPPIIDAEGDLNEQGRRIVPRLAAQLERIADADATRFALAFSPVLCDELRLSRSAAARSAYETLRAFVRGVPLLRSPYAERRLSGLKRSEVKLELDGGATLSDCVEVGRADPLLWVPDGRLDGDAAETAHREGLQAAIFGPADEASSQDSSVLLLDPGEAPRAVARFAPVVTVHDLLELDVDEVFDEEDGAGLASSAAHRFYSAVADYYGDETAPSSSYATSYDDAVRSYETFFDYAEAPRLQQLFTTRLARSRSSAEWDADWKIGRERSRALVRAINNEHERITAADGEITFTSRSGSAPVSVTNDAPYPVKVRVTITSSKLEFPEGNSQVVDVEPPGASVTFGAEARSSGTFPAEITIASPDRRVVFDSSTLTVRSTAVNTSAIVLTVGGAIFFLVWLLRRLGRRRKIEAEALRIDPSRYVD